MKKQTIIILRKRIDDNFIITRSTKVFTAYGKVNNNKKLNKLI